MLNDYFLVAALPLLYIGVGLLQATSTALFSFGAQTSPLGAVVPPNTARQLTAAIELLWIVIFSVKLCFLAQFKFHKPPYAYVSVRLTRYYWACITLCVIGGLYAIIQPIVLCFSAG